MKRLKYILSVLLGVMVMFCAPMRSVVSAKGYTYTVRVYAGNQGTIDGKDVYEVTGLSYDEEFSFDISTVKVTNPEKYYVKGVRLAGEDNENLAKAAFSVTSDVDLVVTYGVKGDQIPYTVRYVVSPGGTEIAKPETLYGNPGDKPVVAYKHIEGYEPLYRNITGTLEPGVEFVFEYTRKPTAGEAGVETTVTTTTVVVDGGTAGGNDTTVAGQANNGGQALPNAAGNAGGNNPGGNQADNAAPAGTDNNAGNDTAAAPAETTTQDILDIDVPLAGNNEESSVNPAGGKGRNILPYVGGGAAVLVVGAVAAYLRLRHGD